jgi:uridylate kinase
MKKIVIKVGGSLLFNKENKINHAFISHFCNIIQEGKNFQQVIIVCGGGSLAREFITFLRKININEALCDTIGIDISRINSKMIMACLKDKAYPKIPKNLEDLSLGLQFNKIITMGGIQPGQSTTTVAMEIAEYIEADKLLILTDVQGIYDKDPDKYNDAKLIKRITCDELHAILMKDSNYMQAAAGEYRIFDMASLQIIRRSKIKVYITSGKNLDEFSKFWLENKEINGTLISC